ncbi:glutathione transferase GstA [Silvanigrella paludirubra]|uniref:Glutathione transferase GstA n=1 Tax=Silvanigrella paludirubra TaxID=2499159 RepID=A0A6N6VRI2_9BACT|nr:glutathione binding-like protein [Silvanigrella paludirubra]KAB8038727.1 glutathione transferase GstA [Silvanigrella paludirubra]
MMKFYFSTATCSTACHIAIEELGLDYTPIEVSWKRNLNVAELNKLNPLGSVPVLVTDQGKTLTQNTAILEYLADQKPSAQLLEKQGTFERNETMSWVAFVASDLQKAFTPFFHAKNITASETNQKEIIDFYTKKLHDLLSYIEDKLTNKEYIMGKNFTIADAYLFTILGWTKWVKINTKDHKNITNYMKRVYDRPAVQKVLNKEGLIDYLQ